MRSLKLLVGLTLLSAAALPQATAAACMLMRSDMAMASDCGHDLVVSAADASDDCPVSRCLPRVAVQLPELIRTADVADYGREDRPRQYKRAHTWAIAPALPPPKRLLSNS